MSNTMTIVEDTLDPIITFWHESSRRQVLGVDVFDIDYIMN